jgi:general nucleoside transport system ATP-binding protein
MDSATNGVLLALDGITKTYGSIIANDSVSLTIRRGHIHAVLGENGAGKSTLMKIIYGVTQPDAGGIRWRGESVTVRNPAHARALGIGMVFQHFSLFDTMTVAENISLGVTHSPRILKQKIAEIGGRLRLEVDPEAPVHALSVGERQRVEIIRCLLQTPDLIIMDEPTAVLPPSAVPSLFATLRQLADEGRAIIFISHKLEEIRSLCHTATVMRQGRVVATTDPQAASADALARLMIGRSLPHAERAASPAQGDVLLVVDDLSTAPTEPHGVALDHVTLRVRAGEIVGIAGVSGNGQRQLVEVLAGQREAEGGAIRVAGDPYHARREEMRRHKMSLLPEEPLKNACVGGMSVADNIAFREFDRAPFAGAGFWLNRAAFRNDARKKIARYKIKTRTPDTPIAALSGGNVQRAVLARELGSDVEVLIAANPCFGLDFAAVAQIHAEIMAARNRGAAVLLVSEDLDELLELSDRLVVMFHGQFVYEAPTSAVDLTEIGRHMAGH